MHDATIAEAVDRYVEARCQREIWGEIELSAATKIRECGCEHRRQLSQKGRKVISTVSLNGMVKVQVINKYRAIPVTLEDRCREVMGEAADKYLTESLAVTVTPVGVGKLQQLLNTLGPERFSKWFEVKRTLQATATLHNDLATDAQVYLQLLPRLDDRTLVPQTATVKLVRDRFHRAARLPAGRHTGHRFTLEECPKDQQALSGQAHKGHRRHAADVQTRRMAGAIQA